MVVEKRPTRYRLAEGTKNLISLTSWHPCDQIFRSHDPTSESVGKGSGHLRKSSERQGKKSGRGGWGRTKSAEVGVVGDDVIEKM